MGTLAAEAGLHAGAGHGFWFTRELRALAERLDSSDVTRPAPSPLHALAAPAGLVTTALSLFGGIAAANTKTNVMGWHVNYAARRRVPCRPRGCERLRRGVVVDRREDQPPPRGASCSSSWAAYFGAQYRSSARSTWHLRGRVAGRFVEYRRERAPVRPGSRRTGRRAMGPGPASGR
jgi:hypothetical protein